MKPSDRLAAAIVCLSWYEASISRLLWNDIILVLDNSMEDVAQVFKHTRKPIQHVRIKVNLYNIVYDEIVLKVEVNYSIPHYTLSYALLFNRMLVLHQVVQKYLVFGITSVLVF